MTGIVHIARPVLPHSDGETVVIDRALFTGLVNMAADLLERRRFDDSNSEMLLRLCVRLSLCLQSSQRRAKSDGRNETMKV